MIKHIIWKSLRTVAFRRSDLKYTAICDTCRTWPLAVRHLENSNIFLKRAST
uniref:Uncharacterized protein n=1 Tax=Oryza brachyantha TaxID=4533 RepID=J3M7Q8_ORYBR